MRTTTSDAINAGTRNTDTKITLLALPRPPLDWQTECPATPSETNSAWPVESQASLSWDRHPADPAMDLCLRLPCCALELRATQRTVVRGKRGNPAACHFWWDANVSTFPSCSRFLSSGFRNSFQAYVSPDDLLPRVALGSCLFGAGLRRPLLVGMPRAVSILAVVYSTAAARRNHS